MPPPPVKQEEHETSAPSAAVASAWRAKELRRRVDNRRLAAHTLVAGDRWKPEVDAAVDLNASPVPLPLPDKPASPFSSLRFPPPSLSISVPHRKEQHQPLSGGTSHAWQLSSSVSLPQLYDARQAALSVHLDVVDMQARQAASLRVCDQQFQVERNVRQLRTGISAAQVSIRHKQDELDALQSRVLRLSKTLYDTADDKNFAKTKLVQLDEIRKQRSGLQQCAVCKKEFLQHMLAAHEGNCAEVRRKAQQMVLPASTSLDFRPASNQLADEKNSRSTNTSVPNVLELATDTLFANVHRLPTFVSQPPRNLRVAGGATPTALLLQWNPPIFTGSVPIIDYELRFSCCTSVTKRWSNGEVRDARTFQALPPQMTSRWCLQIPVAENAFWVRGLVADQEYGDFSLCAVTMNGKSQPSNKVGLVKTAPAMPPSNPCFLSTGAVTAKTISLGWIEPMDDGGSAIEFYEVFFSEAIMHESVADPTREKNFLDVSEVIYKQRRVRTPSSTTSFTIVDLLSGKEHKDFRVRAVNRAGMPGEFSAVLASIFTITPGNEFKLLDELQAAVNSRARIVDSQFLSGFMQRCERNHYIQQVSRFIVSLHPELENKVNDILRRTDMSLLDEDDSSSDSDEVDNIQESGKHGLRSETKKRFDDLSEDEQIQERRRQFHFRISDLSSRLKDVEYNVQWSRDRRIDLVALIRAAEDRILEKQAELERAKMFRGPQMDSDVLENGLQRFYTKDLIFALQDEIGIEQLYIVDAKSEIMQVENYLRGDERKRGKILARLQNRRAALEKFELNPIAEIASTSSSDSIKVASLARLHQGAVYRAFSALVENRAAAVTAHAKVRATLMRFLNCRCRAAFDRWVRVVREVLRRSDGSGAGVYGVGSIGLANAMLDRDELMLQSQELLEQLRTTDERLKIMVLTKEQQAEQPDLTSCKTDENNHLDERDAKYYPFVLEADARMDIEDHPGARALYDFVLSNSQWVESMTHAQIRQLLYKLGKAHVLLKNFEQALALLNRASFLAARLGNRADEGLSTLLIAEAHFGLRSLQLAIESYDQALLCFEAVGDKRGQIACFRGLQSVYAKLEDKEMVLYQRRQADEMEFALSNKLTSAGQVLETLQKRLVGIGAESSTEILLERVGAIVPRLRTQRVQRKLDIGEEEKLVASLEKLLAEKKALLAQGEADLKRALASDTSQVDSSVINGTSARYEIDDFKKKLAKLMGSVQAGEAHIAKEIANAKVRIRNSDDEIADLDKELSVETGDLMRQIKERQKLRCFCFSATNEALKCVVGTASHGVPTCCASSELTGNLFDLLTGACLGQAVGDPHRQHLGPPAGHQAQIVALYYVDHRIYTGGMDAALGVWEVQDATVGGGFAVVLVKMMLEFDAAVVSVVADLQLIVCGCSDCDVFVFDAASLAVVARVIGAHDRSVMAVAVDSAKNWFTTGGADNRVKVWELGASSSGTTRRKVAQRFCLEPERRGDEFFNGHLHPVTCLKQVSSEIVSGDSNGRIVVWNLDAADERKWLRICDVHKRVPVLCLQFDATRIVSGAQDGGICVTDFATGHLIQSLHGHSAGVLDLQFDRKRLVSMSADGRVRLWYWQNRIGLSATKKHHILGAGETLKALSLKYHTSTDQLLKWNGLPDSSKLYLGQKLVVGVDANDSIAADELKTLDMAFSRTFGKVSSENLAFVAANKVKTTDVEAQWASQKLAMLAKEYFPPLDDEDGAEKVQGDESDGDDVSSDSGSDMPMSSATDGAVNAEDGDDDEHT